MAAKSAAAKKPEAPKGPEVKSLDVGKFKFLWERGVTPPPPPAKAPSQRDLPFKEWFNQAAHNDHLFVPDSFWTAPPTEGGRGADPAKVAKPGYVRSKLRLAFNEWRDKDAARANHTLLLHPRKAGDDDGKYPESGFSMFIQIGAP